MVKKTRFAYYSAMILIIVSSFFYPLPAKAGGIVGNGDPGSCTEAAFDSALLNGGVIQFNCGTNPKTIALTSEKVISKDTTIDGGNQITLSGGGATRLFNVFANISLRLRNLVLTQGSASPGGAIYNSGNMEATHVFLADNHAPGGLYGAIYNTGTLTLNDSVLSYNTAGLSGGAIGNDGTMTLTGSTLASNSAQAAGAIYNNGSLTISGSAFFDNTTTGRDGAGIYNDKTLTVYTSIFSGNITALGQKGGGLFNVTGGVATIIRSSFINNSTGDGSGGAIGNEGQLTVLRVLFTANHAWQGGAIFISSNDLTTITNSTISGNNAALNGAGGLFVYGPATILNSTIYNNANNGLLNEGSNIVSLKNTILAGNTPTNCFGIITSQGYNLEDANTCALTAPGDLPNTNPQLGPLSDNGGPTKTHALLPGSPAINAGTNDGCPPADQRGVIRPVFGTCDIGAFEFGSHVMLPMVYK